MYKLFVVKTVRQALRLIKIVIGVTILIIGLALIFLPGPAFVVIPIGLGILATEFVWARKLLKTMKDNAGKINNSVITNHIKNYLHRKILKRWRKG